MKYYKMLVPISAVDPRSEYYWLYCMEPNYMPLPMGGIEVTEEEFMRHSCDDTEEI